MSVTGSSSTSKPCICGSVLCGTRLTCTRDHSAFEEWVNQYNKNINPDIAEIHRVCGYCSHCCALSQVGLGSRSQLKSGACSKIEHATVCCLARVGGTGGAPGRFMVIVFLRCRACPQPEWSLLLEEPIQLRSPRNMTGHRHLRKLPSCESFGIRW